MRRIGSHLRPSIQMPLVIAIVVPHQNGFLLKLLIVTLTLQQVLLQQRHRHNSEWQDFLRMPRENMNPHRNHHFSSNKVLPRTGIVIRKRRTARTTLNPPQLECAEVGVKYFHRPQLKNLVHRHGGKVPLTRAVLMGAGEAFPWKNRPVGMEVVIPCPIRT